MWTILEAYEVKPTDATEPLTEIMPQSFRTSPGWQYIGKEIILTNKDGNFVKTRIVDMRDHLLANDDGTIGLIVPIPLAFIRPNQTMMRFVSPGPGPD